MTSIPPEPPSPQGSPPPAAPDDLLPPVEPPTARFLLQLFVVPAIIVAGVVLLWFTIESLARSGEQDPDAILKGLRSNRGFQQAKDLADMLNVPERFPELRSNAELAGKIGEYLIQLVDAGGGADSAVRMRLFLASALGQFQAPDGFPGLIHAALHDPAADVRRMAVHQMAQLAATLGQLRPPQTPRDGELVDALATLAVSDDNQVRSWTAVALGWIGAGAGADPRIEETLAHLIDDPYTDARFNAAQALARLGNSRAPAAVAEMFDPEALEASAAAHLTTLGDEGVSAESRAQQRIFKRNAVLYSALHAIELMVEADLSRAELAPVEEALTKFLAAPADETAPLPGDVRRGLHLALKRVQSAP